VSPTVLLTPDVVLDKVFPTLSVVLPMVFPAGPPIVLPVFRLARILERASCKLSPTEILSGTTNKLVGSFASIIDSFSGSATNSSNRRTRAFAETGESALDVSALSSAKCVCSGLLQVANSA
jgi:hypothetical protein